MNIKVLFPPQDVIIERDKERKCWTTGKENIIRIYNKLEAIRSEIGVDNYIDTSNKTPEETIEKIMKEIK